MEIEGVEGILSMLVLAKELRDIGRSDVVDEFYDELCWDSYFQNLLEVLTSVFSGYYGNYDDDGTEMMVFTDDVFSEYFTRAWEYGKLHKLPHDQNPYVIQAQSETREWLNVSSCVDWSLLAYTKTKKAARQSKLIVRICNCECNAQESVAYGLIHLYSWFAEKCVELQSRKVTAA